MPKSITIEFCKNCKNHSWNTRHEEAKYLFYFNQIKNQLSKSGIQTISTHQYRMGSFQIRSQNYQLFSKLKTQLFPDVDLISKFIVQFFENKDSNQQKYSQFMQNYDLGSPKKKGVQLSPGFGRVSKFSSPNKFAKGYVQMFNAQKQIKNAKLSKIVMLNRSSLSLTSRKSLQKLKNLSFLHENNSVNPQRNTSFALSNKNMK